jgi:hypothetical protein
MVNTTEKTGTFGATGTNGSINGAGNAVRSSSASVREVNVKGGHFTLTGVTAMFIS